MELVKTVKSETDNAIKYVFLTEDKRIVEFTYIDKNDGKDIICVPCQTMCNLGCKFCHTTDFIGEIKMRNLSAIEISDGVKFVYNDLKLHEFNRVLLISYMGVGEPMCNVDNVIGSMCFLNDNVKSIRFAVATCIPKHYIEDFFKFVFLVKEHNLEVKLHFSLHFTDDITRREWMPAVSDIDPAISAIDFYYTYTKQDVEVHYTLINEVNDTKFDVLKLGVVLRGRDFNLKFITFNEKADFKTKASKNLNKFIKDFESYNFNVNYEIYTPPSKDIGSSCGAFLMDEYKIGK